ncbi:MAG: class II fumarate hydratase [Candidatus Thorarchaeota archaeon]
MKNDFRIEKDLLGELEVPEEAYWGINTQRALNNFQISNRRFPSSFLLSLANVKKACLQANFQLEVIDEEKTKAIRKAVDEIIYERKFMDQFPIDIFQTGSGTQINMNMNEVLANRANEILGYEKGKKTPVHPNDHVNMSQSSNDVIPTTMHLVCIEEIQKQLFPAMDRLLAILAKKIDEFSDVVKVGRTHLQDAVPIRLSTEFEVYQRQIKESKVRFYEVLKELEFLPIGGTVLGTGLNAPENFDETVIKYLKEDTGIYFQINPVKAEGIASHNPLVRLSSVLKLLALSLLKLANDIRWMGSGPRAGLAELLLPENEPGSSIMPGKINPTQSEALIQVCIQVIGNDVSITFAEGYGSILDLNVTKPLIIINLLESIEILTKGMISFTNNCLKDLKANEDTIQSQLDRTLMLVTKLSPIIGYEKAGEIAKKAFISGKTIREVVREMGIAIDNLEELLDPKKMV